MLGTTTGDLSTGNLGIQLTKGLWISRNALGTESRDELLALKLCRTI